MKIRLAAFLLCLVSVAWGQSSDVLGVHDLSMGGTSKIKGQMSSACLYCHSTALWADHNDRCHALDGPESCQFTSL